MDHIDRDVAARTSREREADFSLRQGARHTAGTRHLQHSTQHLNAISGEACCRDSGRNTNGYEHQAHPIYTTHYNAKCAASMTLSEEFTSALVHVLATKNHDHKGCLKMMNPFMNLRIPVDTPADLPFLPPFGVVQNVDIHVLGAPEWPGSYD